MRFSSFLRFILYRLDRLRLPAAGHPTSKLNWGETWLVSKLLARWMSVRKEWVLPRGATIWTSSDSGERTAKTVVSDMMCYFVLSITTPDWESFKWFSWNVGLFHGDKLDGVDMPGSSICDLFVCHAPGCHLASCSADIDSYASIQSTLVKLNLMNQASSARFSFIWTSRGNWVIYCDMLDVTINQQSWPYELCGVGKCVEEALSSDKLFTGQTANVPSHGELGDTKTGE